jgi:hypothetical protein
VGKQSLFAVRTVRNTQIQSVPQQETYHVPTTEPNRLMLCGETVAVCCENRTEQTDAVRNSTGDISRLRYRTKPVNAVRGNSRCENRTEHTDTLRTSQETHHVSAIEPNRLMLCGETVAVCSENCTEYTDTVRTSQETSRLRYRAQSVNAVWGNSRCLL